MLKYVTKNSKLDLEYVEVAGFQMDATAALEKAKKLGEIPEKTKLTDWLDFFKNPNKYKGFFITLLHGMFLGKHNLGQLNVDCQIESTKYSLPNRRVAMMWAPYNTTISNLEKVGRIANDNLNGWEVFVLTSNTTNNKKVEKQINQLLEETDKPILIISAIMATRSFSVGKIYENYLCYDGGSQSTTDQRMARALTSDKENDDKTAFIFSLSFDPNRDDKFDDYILETAKNICKRKGGTIVDNIKLVHNSMDFFSCSNDGAVKIKPDDFVDNAIKRRSVSRIFATKAPINEIPLDIKLLLADGDRNYFRSEIKDKIDTKISKTKLKKIVNSLTKSKKDDLDKKVKEMICSLIEHSHLILGAGITLGANNIIDCFNKFESDKDSKEIIQSITSQFNLPYSIIKMCFEKEWISANAIELQNFKRFK
jgi:NAD(P)H-dependent flavin oxidoreductase YrpB (nitropropane dioxygenase family)